MNNGELCLDWSARNAGEALGRLATWGRKAPDRLERLGRQKDLEAWVLNRVLRARIESGDIRYPLRVICHEGPDFIVAEGHRVYGVEVAQASYGPEQEARTDSAKNTSLDDDLSSEFDALPKKSLPAFVHDLVQERISAKSAPYAGADAELILYLRTNAAWLTSRDERIPAAVDAARSSHSFRAIWLMSNGDIDKLHPEPQFYQAFTS